METTDLEKRIETLERMIVFLLQMHKGNSIKIISDDHYKWIMKTLKEHNASYGGDTFEG